MSPTTKTAHTAGPLWAVDDFGKPESLDRLMARYMIYSGGENRVPVAYFFQQDAATLAAASRELLSELKDLHALVKGECPRLLDEDSGGNADQDSRIKAAIARAEGRSNG